MKEKHKWGLDHFECIVPGSFWKLKDEWSLYYLEDETTIDVHLYGYLTRTPIEPLKFDFNKIYFLAQIKEENNFYNLLFLDDTRSVEVTLNKNLWNNVFELVHPTNNQKNLVAPQITLEEIKKKFNK